MSGQAKKNDSQREQSTSEHKLAAISRNAKKVGLTKKNLTDARDILCEEFEKLQTGKTTLEHSKSVSNSAGKIISTIRKTLKHRA